MSNSTIRRSCGSTCGCPRNSPSRITPIRHKPPTGQMFDNAREAVYIVAIGENDYKKRSIDEHGYSISFF